MPWLCVTQCIFQRSTSWFISLPLFHSAQPRNERSSAKFSSRLCAYNNLLLVDLCGLVYSKLCTALRLRYMLNAWLCARYKFSSSSSYYHLVMCIANAQWWAVGNNWILKFVSSYYWLLSYLFQQLGSCRQCCTFACEAGELCSGCRMTVFNYCTDNFMNIPNVVALGARINGQMHQLHSRRCKGAYTLLQSSSWIREAARLWEGRKAKRGLKYRQRLPPKYTRLTFLQAKLSHHSAWQW